MLVLGIETATMMGGVALVDNERLVAEHRLNIKATHAERLLGVVERLLADAGLSLTQLDGFAVSIGPGSFTGLRIGVSTVKGLGFASGKPVVAVPTLDGLAYQLPFCHHPICPILDAKKREVYTAFYRATHELPQRLSEYRVIPPEVLLAEIEEPTVFLGDGIDVYRDQIQEALGPKALFAPTHLRLPSGAAVAGLGCRMLAQGQVVDIYQLEPLYIRPSEVELKRSRRRL